jgi:cell division protein FtsI (penicillin-binding protein 3)
MSLPSLFRRPTTRLIGARKSALDVARGRLVLGGGVFVLLYILMIARLIDLSIIQGELPRISGMIGGDGEVLRSEKPVAQDIMRADIIDRNGVLLARSLKTPSLYADPALIADTEAVARDLVRVLPDLNYGDVLQRLQRKGRFVWIKRNISPSDQYEILKLGHPGLNFKDEAHRIYPQGALTAHVVGFTDVDGNGLAGIERSFNDLLKKGTGPVQLSIDIRLQHIVRRELAKSIREFDAIGGVGAIIDVQTGEILAAVSAPDFNPHDLRAAKPDDLFNRLTLGVYEMGSTFKIFSVAALLEIRNPPLSQKFDAREPIAIGRFRIRDFHPQNRLLTVPEVFMHSSNIGTARMAEMIGSKAFQNFYHDLGLLTKSPIELREVGTPIVPKPWRDINTLTASYGHGVAVTPIQTLGAVASIVNGGVLVQPHLVVDAETVGKDRKRGKEVRVVSPQTAHRMRQMMRLVVTSGTAKSADVPGFQVGGKTGTADKTGSGGYDRQRRLSSFIGVFPMNAPRYAVMIMIDEPKGTAATHGYATGGWVAAPAVARVITAMAPVLGLVPEDVDAAHDMSAPLLQYVATKNNGGASLATLRDE